MDKLITFLVVLVVQLWYLLWAPVRLWIKWRTHHDPVEYYASWRGYGLPLALDKRLTKEQADDNAARGYAYYIGYYDADGKKLLRSVKMLRGAVNFEHVYTYYPSGNLKHVKATNRDGHVSERDYAESDYAGFFW